MVDVTEHLQLVKYVVNKMQVGVRMWDDAVGVGNLALVKAAKGFDPTRKIKFSTFAHRCIRNDVLDYLHRYDSGAISKPTKTRSDRFDQEISRVNEMKSLQVIDALDTLFSFSNNTVLGHVASNETSKQVLPEASATHGIEPTPLDILLKKEEAQELRDILLRSIQELDELDQCILLKYSSAGEDLLWKDIAEQGNVSISVLHYAHQKLLGKLQNDKSLKAYAEAR